MLENAYSIEMLSEHPLAKAVTGYVKDNRDIATKNTIIQISGTYG
ncbi:MAG: hypothetical protein ACLU8S_03115 [Coprococcus phoceensis]